MDGRLDLEILLPNKLGLPVPIGHGTIQLAGCQASATQFQVRGLALDTNTSDVDLQWESEVETKVIRRAFSP